MERREITPEYTALVNVAKKLAGNKELLRQMDEVPRYERYFTGTGEKIWDMDERGHAINTNRIVRLIGTEDLKTGKLSQEEFDRLRIAALIHDLGEIEVGDVSYDEKGARDEEAEKKSFEEKLSSCFPEITAEEKVLILEIYHEITQNKDRTKKLPKYFNLVERLGYISNAIEVFEKQPENVDWPWLVGNVLHNQGKHLVNYLKEFESARNFLGPHKETIKAMLEFADQNRQTTRDLTDDDVETWKELLKNI